MKIPGLETLGEIVGIMLDPSQMHDLSTHVNSVEEVLFPVTIRPGGDCNLVETMKQKTRTKKKHPKFLWAEKLINSSFYRVLIIGRPF